MFIVTHLKLIRMLIWSARVHGNAVSIYHDAFDYFFHIVFRHLLALEGMKVHRSFDLLLFISPPVWFFLAFIPETFFIRNQFHCKSHC